MENYSEELYNEFKLSLDETIEEYDVENYDDLKEFIHFIKNMKEDINEAEYQGRKVKLGKPTER